MFVFFFFKHKTAYEMRMSDWSSDVCSSDLPRVDRTVEAANIDAPRVGVAAIEDRIAAADGLHHFEPAPRIAGRLGVGDIVADRRERARIGLDRKSVVEGKSVSVRVDLGGRQTLKKKNHKTIQQQPRQ